MKNPDFALDLFLPYLLNQAAERASMEFARIYKDRHGLLRTDWRVLFHLGLYGKLTAQDIGARADIHKTKVSRAVKRLAERRYVVRDRDTNDRRREHLTLTPAGRAVYDDLHRHARAYEAKLTADFTQAELQALRKALLRLAAPAG